MRNQVTLEQVIQLEQDASRLIGPLVTLFLRMMRRPVFAFIIASVGLVFLRSFLGDVEGFLGNILTAATLVIPLALFFRDAARAEPRWQAVAALRMFIDLWQQTRRLHRAMDAGKVSQEDAAETYEDSQHRYQELNTLLGNKREEWSAQREKEQS
jgi:hypothetical protein